MTISRRAMLAAATVMATSRAGWAQGSYPDRPIRMIVPFPPGGATDVVARLVAQKLTAEFGQQVVVDNKAGAGSVVGTEIAAKAPADGYTILFTTPGHTINAGFRSNLSFDTEKDFAPVTLAGAVPMYLVAHPSVPFTDYKGFLEYARKNPGKLNFSSAGNGTLPHIVMEVMLRRLGIEVTHVAYRGAAPAMADLLSGQVHLKLDAVNTATPLIRDKRLIALAATSRQRTKAFPDLPTMNELGLPGFEGYLWVGVVTPTGTPKPVIDKLAAAITRAVASPDIQERFDKEGIEAETPGPDAFRALIAKEIAQYRELARTSSIKVD
jgi:tripartite-type tricarboxylate transporter receptor subunit TctC